ncbi:MAG: DUF255 domain-containing protein [Saprospiraceae bacterium]|nr:DUF255 domain-containing protein [Saprospiraceae bacterium]
MKKIAIIPLLLFFTITFFGQGINFHKKPWDELKSLARTENKFLFVDCYTDWCGWCKVMDQKTFSDPEVIKFMNEKFISAKIDMEKGQGITLAMKYRVTGFPSYLIFSPEGKLVYKTFGYQKVPDFLKNLNSSISTGQQQFYNGISDEPELNFPEFYINAFAGNGKRVWPDINIIDSYFRTETNWYSEVSFSVLSRFEVPDTVNRFFLKNIEQYRYLYSIDADDKISGMIYRLMSKAVKNKDMKLAGEAFSMIDMYIKEDRNEIKQSYLLMYLSETSDWKNFSATFQKVLDTEGYKNSEMINNYAWNIYKECDYPDVISKAAEWMKKVTDADPQYMFLDTYAALLFKSKNYTEAEIYAKKAIKNGKKNKEDIKETKELLEKIKQIRKN